MRWFKIAKQTAVAVLVSSTLAVITGCHSTAASNRSETSAAPAYEPSGGGAAVAAERPGAGVGAQTGVGAAADVPEATEKGAGASNLAPNPQTSKVEITDPTTLSLSSDPTRLAGRPVSLSDLRVQQVFGNQVLALSRDYSTPLLYARLPQPGPIVKRGDTVSLKGTIDQVPSNPETLGLDPQASQALQGQPIYIDAKQIQVKSE